MFIGHLPASYLLAQSVSKISPTSLRDSRSIVLVALIGGVLPDVDLLYFYTIGERQVVHHKYWSHTPIYWVVLFICFSFVTYLCESMKMFKLLCVAFLAIVLHIALDTMTGAIHWLHPFSATTITLVHVPAVHGSWVANFLLHWTFAVELLVLISALVPWPKYPR